MSTNRRISRYTNRMRAWYVTGVHFYNSPYKSAILDLSILFKTNYLVIIQYNKTLFSKFLSKEV